MSAKNDSLLASSLAEPTTPIEPSGAWPNCRSVATWGTPLSTIRVVGHGTDDRLGVPSAVPSTRWYPVGSAGLGADEQLCDQATCGQQDSVRSDRRPLKVVTRVRIPLGVPHYRPGIAAVRPRCDDPRHPRGAAAPPSALPRRAFRPGRVVNPLTTCQPARRPLPALAGDRELGERPGQLRRRPRRGTAGKRLSNPAHESRLER
jgi:hypothetical protein